MAVDLGKRTWTSRTDEGRISGWEQVRGDAGRDTISGTRGRDLLVGGPGRDTINGNANRDRCSGEKLKSCEVRLR